jgi:BlaI family penicillinase repressor
MLPHPTDAELDILAVLWHLGPSTVRAVHQALGKSSGYTTTLKQMQVMTEKGLLVRDDRARSHIYRARAPKEQTRQQVAADLLRRCFAGSAKDLLLGALAAEPASEEELAEIQRVLKDLEKNKAAGRS